MAGRPAGLNGSHGSKAGRRTPVVPGPVSSEVAYEALRTAIIEGQLGPGERIVEQRVAAELNVSRTPVREAVRMLAADGLVVASRHRGATVRTLDRSEVRDLYGLRARLEAYAAELASSRATADDVEELDAGIAEFDVALHRGDLSDLDRTRLVNQANKRVHNAVVQASGHGRLGQMLANTVDVPMVFSAFRFFNRAELERSNNFHRYIRDQIAAGEPRRAASLMYEHIMQGRDQVLRQLDQESTPEV
ncbi:MULTISPECIES: GntR family transcriptional regulator [unclassified Nocardioides]|uniref:GntR family transcriptional regulator n=1 Tax=unclassified Nocardioides TaxID=2615069 RepID=UPI003622A83D